MLTNAWGRALIAFGWSAGGEEPMADAVGMFRHAVASGDPLQDRVVIWARVSTDGEDPVDLDWMVGRDRDLRDPVASGTVKAGPDADFTARVDVAGLEPDTRYFYRFETTGERSPVGRTRTLPARTDHLRFAAVSCAKYNAGFLNAYGRIAERDDVQFLLHLGDYIYEASQNPPASQTKSKDIGRPFDPIHECVSLDDYRRRYALYRLDPDVQALHLAHPLIATVDDHEFADGAWKGGSTEHRPERDGPWSARMAAAFRARWEWMPYRQPDAGDPTRVWRSVDLGGLAELILIDTMSHRDDPGRPGAMADPEHSQLGSDQASWFVDRLRESTARWRVLGNGSCMTPLWRDGLPEITKAGMLSLKLTNPDFTGPDPDQWDGYPFERDRILQALGDGERNAVVLSGDVHVGLASELFRDPFVPDPGEPVAVEFVTTSLTSQNVYVLMGCPAATETVPMERAYVDAMPHVHWTDWDGHGYLMVDIDADRVRGEWWFVDQVLERVAGQHMDAAFEVRHGSPRLVRTS